MEHEFVCPDCGHEHSEPLEATLGRFVRCLDCLVIVEEADRLLLAGIAEAA